MDASEFLLLSAVECACAVNNYLRRNARIRSGNLLLGTLKMMVQCCSVVMCCRFSAKKR